jgi:hypothetical protein
LSTSNTKNDGDIPSDGGDKPPLLVVYLHQKRAKISVNMRKVEMSEVVEIFSDYLRIAVAAIIQLLLYGAARTMLHLTWNGRTAMTVVWVIIGPSMQPLLLIIMAIKRCCISRTLQILSLNPYFSYITM